MSGIVLATTLDVESDSESIFESFADPHGGWLFHASCDRLSVGQPISLDVPFGQGASTFTIYGRISALHHAEHIVIEHVQPWRGRITVRIVATGAAASRVTLTAEVDDEGVAWLVRRAGIPAPLPPRAAVHRIGLLTSKTGPGAVFALATENAATLAIEDLNASQSGPVRFELVVGDDATNPTSAGLEVERLANAGCRAIIASVTSASFAEVHRAAHRRGLLAVHPLLNEGGKATRSAIRLGERPSDQIRTAAGPIMRSTGSSRWFIVGHDYSWSTAASRVAHQILPSEGGTIVGEARVPLDHADYSRIIERIRRSQADLILTTLVGKAEVDFERACYTSGLRETTTTLSLVMEESTRDHIGVEQSVGIWSALGYFQNVATEANIDFVSRYRARFGPWAPPLSTLSESVYSALMILERALVAEPDGSPVQLIRAMRGTRRETPRGLLSFNEAETYTQAIKLAIATPFGFRLLDI